METKSRGLDEYICQLDQVQLWRMDRFLELGFHDAIALILATAHPAADWHKARRMLDAGFDHRAVAREFL